VSVRPSWDLRYLESLERRLKELEGKVASLEDKLSKLSRPRRTGGKRKEKS